MKNNTDKDPKDIDIIAGKTKIDTTGYPFFLAIKDASVTDIEETEIDTGNAGEQKEENAGTGSKENDFDRIMGEGYNGLEEKKKVYTEM
jgi:hypothetical protein